VTLGNAIVISGTAGTDVIVLRGLSLESTGASVGINMVGHPLKALHVQSCSVSGFGDWGIYFEPNVTGASLFVEDTTVTGCTVGIYPFGGNVSANPHVSIDRCRVERSDYGIWLDQATVWSATRLPPGTVSQL